MTTKKEKVEFLLDNINSINPAKSSTAIKNAKPEDLDVMIAQVQASLTEKENEVVSEETVEETVAPVSDLKYETLKTEKGVSVEVVWLPFRKYSSRKNKAGIVVTNYQFGFGNNVVTTQNALLKDVRRDMQAGDLFPFRVESIKPVVSDTTTYGYGDVTYYAGGIAEFACDLLVTKRIELEEELADLAGMDKEAQELIQKANAFNQASSYMEKKGIKIPAHLLK